MLKWLECESESCWDDKCTKLAVLYIARERLHDFDILKWLHDEQKCKWRDIGDICCEDAAKHGHLDLLQWLHKSGCPLVAKRCLCLAVTYIAKTLSYDFEILEWLYAHMRETPAVDVSQYKINVFYYQIAAGHLELQKWLDGKDLLP